MKKIDFFHTGPQKSGTTWIYRCLKEHPAICAPQKDSVHYFDMNYHRGEAWLDKHFTHQQAKQLRYDPSYSYLRSPLVPHRIYKHNPNAKIALTLREPIERAFSHYWHEKKKRAITSPLTRC